MYLKEKRDMTKLWFFFVFFSNACNALNLNIARNETQKPTKWLETRKQIWKMPSNTPRQYSNPISQDVQCEIML